MAPDPVNLTCDPVTWEAEAGGSGAQGHPLPQSEFRANLSYVGVG